MPFEPRPSPIRARLTVVESVVWQPLQGAATQTHSAHAQGFQSDEQPYTRVLPLKAGAWTPLDRGWLEKTSLLTVSSEKNIELGVSAGPEHGYPFPPPILFAEVLAKTSARFRPHPDATLWVRCAADCKVTITFFPGD